MSRARQGFASGVLALAAVLVAPLAHAQDDAGADDARARAQSFLSEGDEHLRRGDALRERGRGDEAVSAYEDALEAYEAAFDAFPETRIYYPIGRAQQKLGRYRDAHAHYRRVLEEGDRIGDELRAELEGLEERMRARIAAVRVETEPESATVSIDGQPAGSAPFEDPIFLDPGEHAFEVDADAHEPRAFDLEVGAGDTRDVFVALEPVFELAEVDDDDLLDAADVTSAESSPPSRGPLAVGLSVTAGLGLAATVTGMAAVSQHGAFTDDARPSDERRSARETGQIFAVTTDVLLVATAAAAGYTAYYYYGVYRPEDGGGGAGADAGGERAYWLSPYGGGEGGGGLAIGGRF